MTKSSSSIQVSISVPEQLLQSIEKNRNGMSRSDYIRKILESSELSTHEKNANGVVYTPHNLAKFVADKVLSYYYSSRPLHNFDRLNIIDPACGDGELLVSITDASKFYEKDNNKLSLQVFGIDIDKKALQQAERRLKEFGDLHLINTNALCPYNESNHEGWRKLLGRYSIEDGFDIAIANPPWGADVVDYKEKLADGAFTLFNRQFDTSDLFIESTLRNLKKGGLLAFIIPDSLFYQERELLRKHLLTNTKIHFIGRFGEKIFKDINRACAVIICEKTKHNQEHDIDCFRLSVEQRNLILAGKTTFHDAESKLSHKVKQSRFLSNNNYLFNIDIDSELESTYNKISAQKSVLGNYLTSSRGVELSKKGNVIKCPNCSKWSPYPSSNTFNCGHCKNEFIKSDCKKEVIIFKKPVDNSNPLIVGEHISRYKLEPDLWIDTTKNGIKYKGTELYYGKKMLVRKTGIGISASIDYSDSMTNQVVYIFKLKADVECYFQLEFYLALINSRLAFFLVSMSNGEIEWKSHPYVTQTQILDFPLPDLDMLPLSIKGRINSVTRELRETLEAKDVVSNLLDAKIERLVAGIYGLDESDYKSIYKVLDSSQELLTIKALKNISIQDIFNCETL